MQSKTLLLIAIAFAALCIANAHVTNKLPQTQPRKLPQPMSHRMKRSVAPTTCSYMTCAISGGSCSTDASAPKVCQYGEHCDGTTCQQDLPLGTACNPSAAENECGTASCVDTGAGPICQLYHQILPGNPCTQDSQCFYATVSGPEASTCTNGVCAGLGQGASCFASHQCNSGTYCSSTTSTCTLLGSLGDSCSQDSDCGSRYSCLNSVCSARYSQSEGQMCTSTDHCAAGLYCKSGSCAKASSAGRTNTKCDVQSNGCGSDMECSCADYQTQGQSATCTAIQGTAANMASLESSAFQCLDKFSCGSDFGSNDTISCITNNCLSSYCTYFTRAIPELFTDYPSCQVGRMVASDAYAQLIQTCSAYQPIRTGTTTTGATSGAVTVSATLFWVTLASTAVYLFSF